jgi:hypothetical protein
MRWRRQLIEAGTIRYHRPYKKDGAAGAKPGSAYQRAGVYKLLTPGEWRCRAGWRYAGPGLGWVDTAGTPAWPLGGPAAIGGLILAKRADRPRAAPGLSGRPGQRAL